MIQPTNKFDFTRHPPADIEAAARAYIEARARGINDEHDCWVPSNKPTPSGRVIVSFMGQNVYLNRLSYWAFHGAIKQGQEIVNKCECRACGNPWHLSKGGRADTVAAMVKAGRHSHGKAHGIAIAVSGRYERLRKFSDEQIEEIRIRLARGETSTQIQQHVPAHKSLISLIRNGKAHIRPTRGLDVFQPGAFA